MGRAGFVYVLTNQGLPGYVKIGRTSRAAQIRADELHKQYGTIHPFHVYAKQMVADCKAVETLAHRSLKWARVPGSELFRCTPAVAQKAVRRAAIIVLERPWHVRVWHWIVLPRPQRARNAGVGRGSRQETAYWKVWLLAVGAAVIWGVHHYQPELPEWLPPAILRLCSALER